MTAIAAPEIAPGLQPTYRIDQDTAGVCQMVMIWQPFEDRPERETVIGRDMTPELAETHVRDLREHDAAHLEHGTRCLWRDTYACVCPEGQPCRVHANGR